jgi:hypothetical protein
LRELNGYGIGMQFQVEPASRGMQMQTMLW